MKNFEDDNLKITFNGEVLIWYGKSMMQDPLKKLNPYFEEIIPEIDKNILEIRFDKVDYMNSSTIHSVIILLQKLHEKNIKTKVIYDKNCEWQKIAFKTLCILCSIMKNLSISGIN